MDPSILVPIAVALVVVIGVAVALVTMVGGKKKAQRRGQWVHAAYSIRTGGEDCGTWARDRAQKALARELVLRERQWLVVEGDRRPT